MDQNDELIPSFFCVPDITGFTKLVASADVNFTNEMIPAILRKLISCNILKMNVAEIEGDAIFFYGTGRLPSINKVIEQCQLLYDTFTNYVASIKETNKEYYDKNLADGQLGLKIIVHCGKISTSNIKGRIKLIGQDVIIVHKLLKNAIPDNEYILFTEKYLKRVDLNNISTSVNWEKAKKGCETYEYIGDVNYRYVKINPSTRTI